MTSVKRLLLTRSTQFPPFFQTWNLARIQNLRMLITFFRFEVLYKNTTQFAAPPRPSQNTWKAMDKTLTSKDWACRNYIRVTTVIRILMFSVFVDFTSGFLSLRFHFTFSENCGQKQTNNSCDKEAERKQLRITKSCLTFTCLDFDSV